MLVKICCISSVEEAELAISCGADALGLVSSMPSGPGVISEERITEIAEAVGDQAKTVLLTSKSKPEDIAAQFERCAVNAIQLCEWLGGESRRVLRDLLPEAFLLQVVHVTDPTVVTRALDAQKHMDALLLDSGTLTGSVIELGGTGRTHDWEVSSEIVRLVELPVFLAGGLRSTNALEAVSTVGPAGLDVCSGVRTEGRLDETRLKSFFDAVEAARSTGRGATD